MRKLIIGTATVVVLLLSTAFFAGSPRDRQSWPWYLIECRYAELKPDGPRNFLNTQAKFAYLDRICADAYRTRGDLEETQARWKVAYLEYAYGVEIAPDDMRLRNSAGLAAISGGLPAEAERQFTSIIANDPTNTDARTNRGQAREMAGDWRGAIADYSAAIAEDPDVYGAYTYRGRAFILFGDYDKGIADLTQAVKLLPHDPSSNLWLHLARERAGQPDADFQARVRNIDLNRWPGPALKYFLGQLSSDMLQRVAASDPDTQYWHQQCDARFYLGEDALAKKNVVRARSLFTQTISRCNVVDYEWDAAKLELSRLN